MSNKKTVVTRFAPSPTGFLHIGGARTALFAWLYARHNNGKFLLRVEDTDRARSTPESIATIIEGMQWLGLDWDNKDYTDDKGNKREYYSQYDQRERHRQAALKMIERGAAYYCYASPEELEIMRAEQKEKGLPQKYDGRWRDRDPKEAPKGVKPVIRLKTPLTGATVVEDAVMGKITVENAQLDDMILVRSDGTPTYMLAVVVDDYDMGITHVIRGDDHMTNTFRQVHIYNAMGWEAPVFAHLPMILGPDGAKLSKRHGAPAVGDYKEKGYLPETLRNYLLRLCWSHGDDEIISDAQALEWFNLESVGKSPARFDFAKLNNLNAHYIKVKDDADLVSLIDKELSQCEKEMLLKAMPDLKIRAQTLVELAKSAEFLFHSGAFEFDEKSLKVLNEGKPYLKDILESLKNMKDFTSENIENIFREYADTKGVKLGAVAQPFRVALSGSTVSPPIFKAAEILGQREVTERVSRVG
ncbi:MAG: glutamate--tRNA ligase [Alphaproteobacteria bacterium]|nr:glutamate--tRNA ligase [Alphaproteobacteria bacterium]MCL2505137.1 glutamate--tRNA ligase [Alphaproteobacteria bacterium]